MEETHLNSNPKMVAKSGLGLGTVARVRNAEVSATLDTVDALARTLGVQPWQLLAADLGPGETSQAKADSPDELSHEALGLAKLFDMLPDDRIKRVVALNRATEAILRILQNIDEPTTRLPAATAKAKKHTA